MFLMARFPFTNPLLGAWGMIEKTIKITARNSSYVFIISGVHGKSKRIFAAQSKKFVDVSNIGLSLKPTHTMKT